MLVLSRRLNEKIYLPSIGASIQVVAVKPGMVRLGIDAPSSVRVVREELLSRQNAPRRALVVEDDQNERELLAAYLRLAGLEVTTAGDGAEALDYLRRGQMDIVLLDMVLPRCDGPSTVRQIRGNASLSGLKIFGMTGSLDRFRTECGEGAVDRWFAKPLNPDQLIQDLNGDLASEA